MKHLFGIVVIGFLFGLSGCIEIIDDLKINSDGTGTFKYNVNLSSSKVRINSYLALDSLDGKKVPSKEEITSRVNKTVDLLKTKSGITNVEFESDYTNYIFKLKLDFNTLDELQVAIKDVIREENKGEDPEELNHNWLTYKKDRLTRSVPRMTIKRAEEIKKDDVARLKEGSYTSITRFDRDVVNSENKSAVLAKNKQAVMLRCDPYSLIKKTDLLDNTIYLSTSEDDK